MAPGLGSLSYVMRGNLSEFTKLIIDLTFYYIKDILALEK